MAKSIKAGLQRIQNKFPHFVFAVVLFFSIHAKAYTDQIVIETPNIAKTIYDIRIHSLIRHLYEEKTVTDPLSSEWLASHFEDERANYVQQYLSQNYVVENDLNLKPNANDIQKAVQKIDSAFKSESERNKTFASLNITNDDVQQWAMNRLIFESFVSNTIQNRVIITDDKLEKHYQTWKATRFFNKPYEDIKQKVKEDLTSTLLKEEFEKWIDQEKRREKMILKVVSAS